MERNNPNRMLQKSRRQFMKDGVIYGTAVAASFPAIGFGSENTGSLIKALLVTGGCCHDYEAQKQIITEGTNLFAKIDWTIWHHESAEDTKQALSSEGWSDPFDIIVYSICHAHEKDANYINSVANIHKAGKPCAVIHCTLHSYHWDIGAGKDSDEDKEWNKLLGVVSLNHGPQGPAIEVTTTEVEHPAYQPKQSKWMTPKGELYNIKKVYPSATVLANGNNGHKENPVIWVNRYGDGNVFATSLGHHNETMQSEEFLNLLANGIKWAVSAT